MGRRGKVVLARIANQSKRRASLKKRQAGLLNKVSELTTLCDAKAAVVIYSPGDNQPTVWPSTLEARETISKFLSRPETERMANSHTAKSFLEEKIKKKKNKAQQLIKKYEERNLQALLKSISDGQTRIQDLDSEQKEKLSAFVDQKKEELLKYIQRLKAKEQQAPHPPQVLTPASQMPQVSEATSGQMNPRGMTQIVTSPSISAANRLDMAGRLYGSTNLSGMIRHPSLSMPPPATFSMPTAYSAQSVLDTTDYSFINTTTRAHVGEGNYENMKEHATPPSLPFAFPPPHSAPNRLHMTGRLDMPFVGMMQRSLPSTLTLPPPKPFTMPHAQSMTSGVDMTDNGLINTSTRTLTGDANFGGMIQHAPAPYMRREFPSRLGLPQMIPIQYDAGGVNMTGDEYRGNTTRFPTTATTALAQSNFGDEYWRNTNWFPAPATGGLDQINFGGGTSNGGWADPDTTGFPGPATAALDQSNFGDGTISGGSVDVDTNWFPASGTAALDQSNSGGGTINGGSVDQDTAFEGSNRPPFYFK